MIQVVSFTSTLAHTGKYGNTAVLHGDIMDHLHHDNGFTHTGAPEHPHLAATWKGYQQVDHLDPGF